MKQRIKIDGTIMLSTIVITALLYCFPSLYCKDILWDEIFDFLGFIFIFKGVYLRMVARGYKKEFSQKGHGLVTSGPYTFTRNPMYLGTYLIGAGFLLVVWPWWFLILYTAVFLARFNVQIEKEEAHLKSMFGKEYEDFCVKVPRFFPRIKTLLSLNVAKAFPWNLCWSTKERLNLISLPAIAVALEFLQEKVIFGVFDPQRVIYLFCLAAVIFTTSLFIHYRIKK